ncbi:YjbF family lipoprotein [Paracoccus sp. (in: a-proteobacteria)]|uniref:YjbF family lipoprotein n=1 Tax=Paracoccus sp. TaxID=267 RepID=UPI0028A18FD0|nr:YjbF family lipoprotein [Paracoccus sp. (in: a-proteobacteria)]
MTSAFMRNRALPSALLVALVGLSACGNDKEATATSPIAIAGQVAKQTAGDFGLGGKKAEPAPARSPEQMAAEALQVNAGPLILVNFESLGRSQVMAMTGQNGAMRTYMAPSKEAVILRQGMLIGTRGLGNDMSTTEAQTEPLIRAGRAGQGQRTIRYYSGDSKERPLEFTCSTGPGPKAGVMVEDCTGHGASFQNSYISQAGQITVSRQWAGPLGYLTIQTLRP